MANLCAGICSSLLRLRKAQDTEGFARRRIRSTPRVGWQLCRGISGRLCLESVAAFAWNTQFNLRYPYVRHMREDL